VNMFFVVILLVIAFGTVLGLEQYEWKKLMIKLLFAAVLVNFSRLICGVIIDVAQVFMMTFVNGFAATAGGNVINGLNLDKLYNYKAGITGEEIGKAVGSNIDKLITGIGAVFFSSISFFVILAYLFVVLARVVALWTLIILSPIAFISSVLPATQKYASEWWKEFNNYVLAGPIIAFFFWLAFAIVGAGNAFDEFKISGNRQQEIEGVFAGTAAGLTAAMEWGNMASFAVAIALLMIGVKKTQELGVAGASALGTAMSTATKTAKVLSGVAAAGWVGQKSLQAGQWAVKGVATGVAMNMPLVGGNAWKNYYETAKAGAKRRVAKSLAEGGTIGWVYNRATKNAKLNKQLQGENEAWDNVLDDLSGTKANWNQKNKNAGVKEYGELLKRKKEAGAAGVKETAQDFVDTENFGLRDEVLEAELRGAQTAGMVKGREDLSREQIAKRLMSEEAQVEEGKEEKEGFKIKQQELERLKERMEEYKKSSDADKDKISAEAKREVQKDKGFEAMRDQTTETKLETKQIKDEVAIRETNRELKKIEELLKEGLKGEKSDYRKKEEEINKLQAEGSTTKFIIDDEKKLSMAVAQDDEAKKRNLPAVHVARYWSEKSEEIQKSFSGLENNELVSMAEKNGEAIKELDESYAKKTNKTSTDEEQYRLSRKNLLNNSSAIESVAGKKFGSDTLASVHAAANKGLGIKYDSIGAEDVFAEQLVAVARAAGEGIDLKEIENEIKAEYRKKFNRTDYSGTSYDEVREARLKKESESIFEKGKNKLGENAWNATLRSNDIAAKMAAKNNPNRYAGLYDSKQLGEDGLSVYKLQSDKNAIKNAQKYFSAPAANNINNFETFKGLASLNDRGDMVGIDNQGADLIFQTLRNVSSTSRFNPNLINEAMGMVDVAKATFKNPNVGQGMVTAFEKLIDSNLNAFKATSEKMPRDFMTVLGKLSTKIESSMKKIPEAIEKGTAKAEKKKGKK
ncbi:MAG TPA: hypothetical protein PKH95_03080, partial [Candidatus Magasanikbacteria bacterium]|nr:hypothetical protein [Candidatus Magasanikbacteria bacterium]